MKNIFSLIKPVLLITLCLNLAACFEERVVVSINKDGSGVVTHRSYNNAQPLMAGLLGGAEQTETDGSQYNDAYFAARAKEMGTGVEVKNWKLANNTLGFPGYEAEYSFSDINTLQVETSPVDEQAKQQNQQVDSSALEVQHYFTMQDGELIIHTPEPDTEQNQEQAATQASNAMNQQILSMMGNMLKGARVSIQIEALDKIKSTNARHVDGNLVTIMDVRLDQLLQDPALFERVQNYSALNRAEAQALADQIDGLDVDTQAQIKIQF